MRSVNLLPNEGIVAQFDSVRCESPDFKGCESGELTFTTMSLIFSYTQVKVFGKDIEHTFLWALHDIKVVDGRPQLIIDKGDAHQCDILLRKGKLELRMDSHADLVTLANGINLHLGNRQHAERRGQGGHRSLRPEKHGKSQERRIENGLARLRRLRCPAARAPRYQRHL